MTDIRKIRTQLRKHSTSKAVDMMLVRVQVDVAYAYRVLEMQDSPATTQHPDAPRPASIGGFEIFKEAEIKGGFF